MSFLHTLVCSLSLLYLSALVLICILLHEEFKQHLDYVFKLKNSKYQGLRHHHVAHNDSFYIEMYRNMHINFSTIRDNPKSIPKNSLSMPWQRGIWDKKSSKIANSVLSLKNVSQYADKIIWNRQGADINDVKVKIRDRSIKKKVLHVINPFATNDKHIEETQNMTMASIEVARAWMQYTIPTVLVDILTVEIDDDANSIIPPLRPKTFIKYPSPIRYYQNGSFPIPQPQLKDILNAGLSAGVLLNYDIIIYSNMDINLMPHFYAIVDKMSECYETFFINRVEIPDRVIKDLDVLNKTSIATPNIDNVEDIYTDTYINIDTIEEAYKYALQFNQLHPGYDCMITTPRSLTKIIDKVGDVFVGHPPVGSVLAKAAAVVDNTCITAKGLPATFHVGSRNGHWSNQKEALNDLNGKLGSKSKAFKRKNQLPCRPYSMMKSRKRTECYAEIYPDVPLRLKYKLPEDSMIKVK